MQDQQGVNFYIQVSDRATKLSEKEKKKLRHRHLSHATFHTSKICFPDCVTWKMITQETVDPFHSEEPQLACFTKHLFPPMSSFFPLCCTYFRMPWLALYHPLEDICYLHWRVSAHCMVIVILYDASVLPHWPRRHLMFRLHSWWGKAVKIWLTTFLTS